MTIVDELKKLGKEALDGLNAVGRFKTRLAEAGKIEGAEGDELDALRRQIVERELANGAALDEEISRARAPSSGG